MKDRLPAVAWGTLSRVVVMTIFPLGLASAQVGSIRGVVRDKDFDAVLPGAQVENADTGEKVATTDQGTFRFAEVTPGTYTLVFRKEGYLQHVRQNVVVSPGELTDVVVWLAGDFVELDEFVVQDILQIGGSSEEALLQLRMESPALVDSIGSELMSRAGASDAAGALRLVTGATVQEGKFAVIRGLPDRYVSSQMNGVRLPSADEDRRAVELDQFPAAVIESVQVTKTFTPDQQGDASGGAVDVRLKGVPDEPLLEFKTQLGFNDQANGRTDFLTYEGGGVNYWGMDHGGRSPQAGNPDGSWDGAVGLSYGESRQTDHKWSVAFGTTQPLGDTSDIGGFGGFFYERDSSFHDNGVDDSYWVANPGEPLTPETVQGTPELGEFGTALFDVTRAKEAVQWGGMGGMGIESDTDSMRVVYLQTHTAEDKAILAEDTRGKEYYFPGYDPDDPTHPGNVSFRNWAPYTRTQALEYTERQTRTLQFHGRHTLPLPELRKGRSFALRAPELTWSYSRSYASLYQPDKRLFASNWLARGVRSDGRELAAVYLPYKPAATFTLGNLQRIWKEIEERNRQASADLELPYDQWDGIEGYLKVGVFQDTVRRRFDQDTYSNFGDQGTFFGEWETPWSTVFPSEMGHAILPGEEDIPYLGRQKISAFYGMLDLPLSSSLSVIGGARFEAMDVSIVNFPEDNARFYNPETQTYSNAKGQEDEVNVSRPTDRDTLPAVGIVFTPTDEVTVRASYTETIARMTFKEITPILQQEFLGGPVFIGNPRLQMSALKNYDLRLDYAPTEGSLVSFSWFNKDIDRPIEYVQRITNILDFTTAENYPKGELTGYEVEVRQDIGLHWDRMRGVGVGANATVIESEVFLDPEESARFAAPQIQAPLTSRPMTNTPEHLYNLYVTYDIEDVGVKTALFYTVQGDTLVAGAGVSDGNFIPSLYAKEYDTLNFSLSWDINDFWSLKFQAKNLTSPRIERVYRSQYTGADVRKTSYTKGQEFTLGLTLTL